MPDLKMWIEASRPRTLAAAVIPVGLAAALAFADGVFDLLPVLAALTCALLIQVATNFINEIYDFKRGADTAERLGPRRQVAAGLISVAQMRIAAIAVLLTAFVLGLYLVQHAGWEILLVGLLSLLFAWAYTGGPFPLAYKGLGEVFVFLFFGLTALAGTYYVQALTLGWPAILLAIVPGAHSSNILGVNNLRDIDTDPKAGKRTLAVRIGARKARNLYIVLTVLALLAPLGLLYFGYSPWLLISLAAAVPALKLMRQVNTLSGAPLNAVLAGTAKLLLLHGLLLATGLILGTL